MNRGAMCAMVLAAVVFGCTPGGGSGGGDDEDAMVGTPRPDRGGA